MKPDQKLRVKLVSILALTIVLVYLGAQYREANSRQTESQRIGKQWKGFGKIPKPNGATSLFSKTDGGVNPYGIDVHSTMLFELGDDDAALDDRKLRSKLTSMYATFLRDWHPGLWNVSHSGDLHMVTGESGMATIRIRVFWFHQILTKQYSSPLLPIIKSKYPPKEGFSRRFAEVHIVVCTRGAGEE